MSDVIVYSQDFASGGSVASYGTEFSGPNGYGTTTDTRVQPAAGAGPSGENAMEWDGTGTAGSNPHVGLLSIYPSARPFNVSEHGYWFYRWKLKITSAALTYLESITVPAQKGYHTLGGISGSPSDASGFAWVGMFVLTELSNAPGWTVPPAGSIRFQTNYWPADQSAPVYLGVNVNRAAFVDVWHDMELRVLPATFTAPNFSLPPSDGYLHLYIDGALVTEFANIGAAFWPITDHYQVNKLALGLPGQIADIEFGYENSVDMPIDLTDPCCADAPGIGGTGSTVTPPDADLTIIPATIFSCSADNGTIPVTATPAAGEQWT
jgi:hypothetical protein